MWGSGFLSSRYQGVRFSPGKDPVLFLSNPPGMTPGRRRAMLNDLAGLNKIKLEDYQDPEIQARIDQYEMAFRMQSSVPELADLSKEPASVFEHYGPESRKPGTYAANCILARRLAERGLLDDILVIWGGEFGRSVYSQGQLTGTTYGRDHHPRCFSLWLTGGGVRRGSLIGETDSFSYNITKDPVHIHDLNATVLHLLGLDHTRLTVRHQGRDYRLTDVHGNLVRAAMA